MGDVRHIYDPLTRAIKLSDWSGENVWSKLLDASVPGLAAQWLGVYFTYDNFLIFPRIVSFICLRHAEHYLYECIAKIGGVLACV